MILEVLSGINRVLSVIEMGVTAAFLRAAGRPVLNHGVNAFGAPAAVDRRLEAVYVGAGHIGIKVGVFAEGAAEAVPAGLRGQVYLRAERRGYSQRTVFNGGDVAKVLDNFRIECGSQAKRRRPE